MSTHSLARRASLAVAAFSLSIASLAAHAADDQPLPGSFAAIMAIKDPSHFGWHLAAADLPPRDVPRAPAPGSFAAIMAIKDPSHFGAHLPAANRRAQPGCTLRSGSWEAIVSVKDPAHYGPCGRRNTENH